MFSLPHGVLKFQVPRSRYSLRSGSRFHVPSSRCSLRSGCRFQVKFCVLRPVSCVLDLTNHESPSFAEATAGKQVTNHGLYSASCVLRTFLFTVHYSPGASGSLLRIPEINSHLQRRVAQLVRQGRQRIGFSDGPESGLIIIVVARPFLDPELLYLPI